MTETRTVICDGCGEDITTTGNSIDWRLLVTNERKSYPRDAVAMTEVALAPPVDRSHHFCGIPCLAAWMGSVHPDAMVQYDRLLARRKMIRERLAEQRRSPGPTHPVE